jgi:hypothetical protein
MNTASDFFSIGDIIYNSWGYDQTNLTFYKIDRITTRTIFATEMPMCLEKHIGDMAANFVPDLSTEAKIGNPEKVKIRVRTDGSLVNPKYFYNFSKWDGKPKYCSWYG